MPTPDASVPQGLVARFIKRMPRGENLQRFRVLTCRLAGNLASIYVASGFASEEKYNLVIDWVKTFIAETLPKVALPTWLAWLALVPMPVQQQVIFFLLKGAIDASIEGVLGIMKEKK